MNKKGSMFGRSKQKQPASQQETVGLQADIALNLPELKSKLIYEFNKSKERIVNEESSIITVRKIELRETDKTEKAIYAIKDPYQRKIIDNVKLIHIEFILIHPPITGEISTNKYAYYITLLPIDDNNLPRWAMVYWIKSSTRKHPRMFNSLAEDGLLLAIKDIVVKYSHTHKNLTFF